MANRSGRLYFGVSDTEKSTPLKEIMIRNPGDLISDKLDLQVGDELIVKFNNGNDENTFAQLKLCVNDPSHDVGPTGAIPTVTYPGYNEWSAQQLVGFVYCDGTITQGYDYSITASRGLTAEIDNLDTFYAMAGGDGTWQFFYQKNLDPVGWYSEEFGDDPLDLEEFGISYSGSLTEVETPTITVYIQKLGPGETHYWKAFLIDKATADTYGVTKLITNIEDIAPGENEDVPVGWGLINQLIEDKLDDMVLGQELPVESSNWYKITLAVDDESEPFTSIELPAKVTSTNQLINNGAPGTNGKFWSSTTNNYFDTNSLGIGYQYKMSPTPVYKGTPDDENSDYKVNEDYTFDKRQFVNHILAGELPSSFPENYTFRFYIEDELYKVALKIGDGEEVEGVRPNDYGILFNPQEYIDNGIIQIILDQQIIDQGAVHTIIPWYKQSDPNQLLTTIGWGSLKAYQNDWEMANGEKVAENPQTRIYGNSIRLGIGKNKLPIGEQKTEKFEVGITDTTIPSFTPLFWINNEKAQFNVPVNFNAGTSLEIGGTEINNYITEVINSYTPSAGSPIFKTAILESTVLKYHGGSSVPDEIRDESTKTKYIKPTKHGGNLEMRVPSITGYSPVGLVGYNVNAVDGNESADNFYVWECYYNKLESSGGTTTQDKKVHFGLKCTLSNPKDNLTCHFEVRMLYAKNGWAGIVGHLK